MQIKTDRDRDYVFTTDIFSPGAKIKVRGRAHYEELMVRGGFVPYEEAQKIAYEANKKNAPKDYEVPEDLAEFLRDLRASADKNGNIVLGNRALAKMREFGVNVDQYLPDYLRKEEEFLVENKPTEGSFI